MTDTQIDPGVADLPPTTEPRRRLTLSFGVAAVLSMLGVLLVTVAYAFGRADIRFGTLVWWIGQFLVYVPLFWHVVSTKWGARPRWALVGLTIGVESYLIKWLYSPVQLRFIDEFQHLRGMWNTLDAGHIAAQNDSLPIAQYFPGLQSISASFSAMTGFNANAVGLTLSGIAHVATTLLVFEAFRALFGSGRAGAVAGLVYCTNSSFTFFNSYFVYETFALPFMMLTILLIVRLRASETRRIPLAIAAFGAYVATLVTHHVTVMFLGAFVILMLIDLLVRRELIRQRALLVSSLASLVATAIYAFFVRHQISVYFRPYTTSVLSPGARPIFTPGKVRTIQPTPTPRFDFVATYLGIGILALVMLYGLWQLIRHRNPWAVPFGGFAALFAISLPLNRLLPFGSQIYGRASTYVYLGVAFVFVVAVARMPRKWRGHGRPVATVVFALAVAGGLAVAVPAAWQRLPGGFYPKGYESGYDQRVQAAGQWVPQNLPTHQGFMTDANGNVVLSTVSNENVIHQGDQVFYLPSLDPYGYRIIRAYRINYAWVDSRLATVRSPSARYFYGSSNGYFQAPPSVGEMDKFAKDPNLSRLYDDGKIRIYDLTKVRR